MLVHVHVLVNAQQHYLCMSRRSHMCLLQCNLCGGITDVVLSLWTSMACQPLFGLPDSLWFLSVCVGHLRAVFTTSWHRLYCTKIISYFSAVLLTQGVAVSASARRNSLCPHCQECLPAYPYYAVVVSWIVAPSIQSMGSKTQSTRIHLTVAVFA